MKYRRLTIGCVGTLAVLAALLLNFFVVKNARSTYQYFYAASPPVTDDRGIQYELWLAPTLKRFDVPFLYHRGVSEAPFHVGFEARGDAVPFDSVTIKQVIVKSGDNVLSDVTLDDCVIPFRDFSVRQAWHPRFGFEVPIAFEDGKLIDLHAEIVLNPGEIPMRITATRRCGTCKQSSTLADYYASF